MLKSYEVEVKWNSKNKQHFVEKGYEFTKMKDSFLVKVDDLKDGSIVKVEVICDYCGKEYQKQWHNYLSENKESYVHKDCCNECKKFKIQETSMKNYGVNSVFLLPKIKEQIKKTNIEKYGTENPFASDYIKDKIAETNLQKYGHKSPMQSSEIKDKMKKTCIEKYGVSSYLYNYHNKGELNHKWKGGVKYHRVERATNEYKNWRVLVYQRDNYTCQCCGIRSGKDNSVRLEAHHIKNWNDNVNDRYDVTNGITFCQDCHILFHQIYGKKDNTKEQLNNYLSTYGKKIC